MSAVPATAVASPPWRPLYRRYAWLALAGCLASAVLVTWLLQQQQLEELQATVQRDADQLADQVHALSSDGRVMGGVLLLGLVDTRIKDLLAGRTTAQDPALQAMLAAVVAEYAADNVLVLDRHGKTVAYRTENGSTRGLGRDLSVRPYFRRAMVGHANLYPAIGKNTGERGIYLAAPVREQLDAQSDPVGVVVVKIGAERIDAQLGRYPHAALLVSPEGVVFGGNRSQWLLQTLAPIGADEQAQLAREERYGDLFSKAPPPVLPLQPLADGLLLPAGADGMRLDGVPASTASASLDWPTAWRDWRVLVLRQRTPAENGGVALAGGAATLLVTLALAFGLLRREARRARAAWKRGQAEAAVARELAFQQRLIDALPNPLFIKDAQGCYTTINRAFEQAYGVRREELIGRTVLELAVLDPLAREQAHACDMQIIASGGRAHLSFDNTWADGRLHQTLFWGQALDDADGTRSGMVGVLLDVSEQAQAQRDLQAREQELRALLESAPGTVIAANAEGQVLFHNQQALEMFRIDAQTLAAQGMRARYVEPAQRAELMQRLHRDGVARATDLEMLRGDGSRFWAQISFSRGSFSGQHGVGFGWCVDITERKRTAEAMQAAKEAAEATAAAKSAFLANMSHELRTPLNAIIGMAHVVLQTRLTDQQRDQVQRVHNAARGLLGVVGDVLDFSRIEAGRLVLEQADFGLDALLERLARQHGPKAGDKGLELVFDIGDAVPRQLRGDAARLEQTLGHLLTNAVKFTERGEIVLQCRHRVRDDGAVLLELAVRDTGIGLTPEQLARLFQPFTQVDGSATRRFGGTGLGLSLCKRLVEAAGGGIAVQGEPGAGACVRFDWPCQPVATQPAEPLPEPLKNLRALVLEPHALAAQVLLGVLARAGVPAQRVDGLQAALEQAEQAGTRCLLLVEQAQLDAQGLALLGRPRAGPSPVVVMAARADAALRDLAAQAGAAAVLCKPATQQAVVATLAQAVAEAGSQPQAGRAAGDALLRQAGQRRLGDAEARDGLQALCTMLESMDGETAAQLERMRGWLAEHLPAQALQALLRHVERYNLDEALDLLRGEPALAPWLGADARAAPQASGAAP
ncbi:PAS domain S-box protein [Pseudorhodoferax sp.]|uniref:PAS domain S-box protein n=1 Tax=Pseudorhodoferax sp. TaxID=1993553 RepID=UPI002DD6918C|nr:PAS domain S-box protein [Pseudorhodoferax sp.]